MSHPAGELLSGVSVVSIAQNVPGPLAVARLVADGAAAVKVEAPSGDPFQPLSPSWYDEMHRGVTVERLDLKSDRGRDGLISLLQTAHVFVTSHRPSALARLRIDPETLHAEVPHLRTVRIVGDLDHPEAAGHDLTYQAEAGLLGEAMPRTLAADVMASERVYSSVLAVLRQSTGSMIDVGLIQSVEPLRAPIRHGLTTPTGVLGGGAPRYNIYRAKSGHVALAALEPHFEKRFYELGGLAMGSDPSSMFLDRSADEWEAWGRAHDVPVVAVARLAGD